MKKAPYSDCDLPPIEQCLFLPIDVQREFCDPSFEINNLVRGTSETDEVSLKIAEISPIIRERGMDIGWVFFTSDVNLLRFRPETAFAGFHHVQPAYRQDAFFPKSTDSAFHATPIRHAFNLMSGYKTRSMPIKRFAKRHKKKTFLTCGFNLTACVSKTVCDALTRGHDVVMITDLCANDAANPNAGNIWNTFQLHVQDAQINHDKKRPMGQCYYMDSATLLSKLAMKTGGGRRSVTQDANATCYKPAAVDAAVGDVRRRVSASMPSKQRYV